MPGGLSLDELADVAQRVAQNHVVGLEVAEFETPRDPADDFDYVGSLLDALAPLLR